MEAFFRIFYFCLVPLLIPCLLIIAIYGYRNGKRSTGLLNAELDIKKKEIEELSSELEHIRLDSRHEILKTWFSTLSNLSYRNETEVEVKFIAPLLAHLGFHENLLDVRRGVSVQVGRNNVQGEADWVAWDKNRTRPLLIVEAKGPNHPLDSAVKGQARSYAYALNGISYMLTNGSELILFERALDEDIIILRCTVDELALNWKQITEYYDEHRMRLEGSLEISDVTNNSVAPLHNQVITNEVVPDMIGPAARQNTQVVTARSTSAKVMPQILLSQEQAYHLIQTYVEDYQHPKPHITSGDDLLYWVEHSIRELTAAAQDDTITVSPHANGLAVRASHETITDVGFHLE